MDVRIKKVRKEYTGVDQHLIVDNDQLEKVKQDVHQDYGRHHKENIGKDHHTTVGGDDLTKVTKSLQIATGGDVRIESGGGTEIKTTKSTAITSGEDIVLNAKQITLKGAGGFITINASGIYVNGNMVYINSGGSPVPPTTVAKKDPEKPKPAAMADDSKAGKVEQSKGMGHATNPQTWKKQTVQDIAAQNGAPFVSTDPPPKTGGTGGGK
jgi:type VI secretion system secreted protein VgrG